MEVKIYDKDGNVIAQDINYEGSISPGHYDFELSGLKKGIQFFKKDTSLPGESQE